MKHGGKGMFEELYRNPQRLEQFVNAMAGISLANFEAFAEKFDFAPYKTMCDVGGAGGQLSIAVARRHPHMMCTTCDLQRGPSRARPSRRTDSASGSGRRHWISFVIPCPKRTW